MDKASSKELQKIPFAPLGVVSLDSSRELGQLIDSHLIEWREQAVQCNDNYLAFPGYHKDSFLVSAQCCRFSSGEGKAVINQTIRGYDLFIISDVGNYDCKYTMYGMPHEPG
jgi:ribose-phosphate pyrophosphokinase